MSFLSDSELRKIGFKKLGKNVKISEKRQFITLKKLRLGIILE